MTSLSDNEARRLGFGPNSVLRLDRPAAVKTGTTTNFHDNWTVGYTPHLVVGVWVGNTNYEPMRDVTGLTGAAPIWHEFMRAVLSGKPEDGFTRPEGLVQVEVCALSGLLPTPACPYRRLEWFIQGTQPTGPDHYYQVIQVDTATSQIADENTPAGMQKSLTVLDLPPQAQPWARANGYPLLNDYRANSGLTSPTTGDPSSGSPVEALRILSPVQGVVYRISSSTQPESQRLMIEAAGEPGLSQISLWIDGQLLAAFTAPPYRTWWTLSEGQHQVWVEAAAPRWRAGLQPAGTLHRAEIESDRGEPGRKLVGNRVDILIATHRLRHTFRDDERSSVQFVGRLRIDSAGKLYNWMPKRIPPVRGSRTNAWYSSRSQMSSGRVSGWIHGNLREGCWLRSAEVLRPQFTRSQACSAGRRSNRRSIFSPIASLSPGTGLWIKPTGCPIFSSEPRQRGSTITPSYEIKAVFFARLHDQDIGFPGFTQPSQQFLGGRASRLNCRIPQASQTG